MRTARSTRPLNEAIFTQILTLFAHIVGPCPTAGCGNIMAVDQRLRATTLDGIYAGTIEFYCVKCANVLIYRANVSSNL